MIKIIKAKPSHLNQITELVIPTGYWDACLKHNSRRLSSFQYMRDFILPPYLPFAMVAVDDHDSDKVLGVIIALSKNEYENLPENKQVTVDPKVMGLFKRFFEFQINESYHIGFLAVDKQFRRQGIGIQLLSHAEEAAKIKGFSVLSLTTVNCQSSSIRLYLKFGMMINQVIALSPLLPFPYSIYFEKKLTGKNLHDYFETEEYRSLDLHRLAYG